MADARVLVVDDEKSMRDLLAITLEKQHYEVTVADGGQAAIATLRREPFDVVITDLRMPTGRRPRRCSAPPRRPRRSRR